VFWKDTEQMLKYPSTYPMCIQTLRGQPMTFNLLK